MRKQGELTRADPSWAGVGRVALLAVTLLPVVRVPELLFPSVTAKGVVFQSAVGAAAAVLLWLAGSRVTRLTDARDPVLWALLAFLGASALSSVFGPSPHHSFFGTYERSWGLVQWVALVVFYVLLRSLFRDADWAVFLRCTLYVAAAVALYAGLEFAVESSLAFETQVASTLGSPGYVSAYLLVAAGTAFLVADRHEGAWRWPAFAGSLVLFLTAILLTQNRSSLLGLAAGGAGAVLLLVVAAARRESIDRRWLYGVLGLLATGAGSVFLFAPDLATRMPGLENLAGTSLTSTSLLKRYEMWEAALEGVRARPVLGWGAENFSLVHDRFVDPAAYRLGSPRADRAHNALLDRLVQSGPAGLMAYLAFWAGLVGYTIRGWWTRRLRSVEAAGLLLAFAGYFVFLQMWFEDLSSAALLVALAAYLRHRYTGGSPLLEFERERDRSTGRTAVWAGVCALFLGAVLWTESRSALAAHRMYQAAAAPGLTDRVERYEQARRLDAPEHRGVAARYALAMGNVGFTAGGFVRGSESLRKVFRRGVGGAEQALNLASSRNPLSSRLDEARGRLAAGASVVYGSEEIESAAVRSMEAAIEKSPPILAYRHFLAHLHARFGDRDAAGRTLRETLEVYDGYGRTYYLMAQVSGGDVDAEDLRYLRQAFWLGFRPEDRSELRLVVDRLVDSGRPDSAERLLSVYFASHYLPSLRVASDPYREERQQFFDNLDAEVPFPGMEYRSYEIQPEDLILLAKWPRAAMAAGECERATLAMRLLIKGLSEGSGTASIRPTLARQLAGMQEDCSARPRQAASVDEGSGGAWNSAGVRPRATR